MAARTPAWRQIMRQRRHGIPRRSILAFALWASLIAATRAAALRVGVVDDHRDIVGTEAGLGENELRSGRRRSRRGDKRRPQRECEDRTERYAMTALSHELPPRWCSGRHKISRTRQDVRAVRHLWYGERPVGDRASLP